MKTNTIGVVGVGLMGHGIATSLQRNGWKIGFSEHPGNQPTDDLISAGAFSAATPGELAAQCDTVVIVVTGVPQVREVVTGKNGIAGMLNAGTVVIDCSTSLPVLAGEMADAVAAAGGSYLDAPMTRTPKEAAEGRLNLIVGGEAHVLESRRPVMRAFAENIIHAGGTGTGQALKLLHNYVSLGFSAVLCEAAAVARQTEIRPSVFVDILQQGAGAGAVLDRIAPFILDGDGSRLQFTIANAHKDMRYYCEMGELLGAQKGVADAVQEVFGAHAGKDQPDRFVPELVDLLTRRNP